MHVLITGGAGFIGTNLVNHLVQQGTYRVVVLDNLSTHQQQPRFPDPVRFVHGASPTAPSWQNVWKTSTPSCILPRYPA